MKLRDLKILCSLVLICFLFGFIAQAQTKSKKTSKKSVPQSEAPRTSEPNQTETPLQIPQKKNQRTVQETSNSEIPDSNKKFDQSNRYLYEFEAPSNFQIRRIQIEHDENGKGKITFWEKDLDEEISEPIELSPTTLEKIKSLFQALNFLESTEEYQYQQRDYSHLGTTRITLKTPFKERSVQFNWTERKEAKELASEYRRISNQFIWQFEINLARENQPLNAPSLMNKLDAYLRLNEIADPLQMLPLLEELTNDERIPLIARNYAKKLAEKIKGRKK